ncbi:hypothetical protein [Enterobacter sp. CP102]|uniref:hypothetical protein n=1 Tax=Enterobacter sp. CP102 TaxID=2976431 RepID=UPI002202671E|nr:hypothetical protein [Enterobacter sp. CP102]UWM66545.1 hypothetical protein N1249_22925 [Enterobacter sp. CP102]
MTIASGWIGSSAVGETAQRWMSAAGPTINVGVPFWMSALAGKSKGLKIVVARTQIGVLPPGVKGPQPFPILAFGFLKGKGGSVIGDYSGREVTGLYFDNAYGYVRFILAGAMSGSVSLVIAGTRYSFAYNSNYSAYVVQNTNLQNLLINSVGKTIEVTF